MALTKATRRLRIKRRIRKVVNGVATSPRLSVFRSNKGIYVQLIDDVTGKTLVAAASTDKGIAGAKGSRRANLLRSRSHEYVGSCGTAIL